MFTQLARNARFSEAGMNRPTSQRLIPRMIVILAAALLLCLAASGCDADETPAGSTTAKSQPSLPQDGSPRYTATLPETPCVSSSPTSSRWVEETELVLTVRGEDISVDATSMGETQTYNGKMTPADRKFTITSENPITTLQIVGTVTETGVSGIWRLTYSDGDQCIVTFRGDRV